MHIVEIPYINPIKAFESLILQEVEVPLFLDSVIKNKKTGRYSFICIDVKDKITIKNSKTDGFEQLKNFYEKHKNNYKNIPFYGIFGYISYDAVKYIENIPDKAKDDIKMPHISFFLPKTLIVFDNIEKKGFIVGDKISLKTTRKISTADFKLDLKNFNMSKEYFKKAVNKIKRYIASGDSFQVNFSQRLNFNFTGNPVSFYKKLREVNPSPFSFYLDMDGFKVVSSSPERLIKKFGKIIETRPIAGTRRRGRTLEEDKKLSKDLFLSEKERAEHIMLVDLERNDIGKIAKYGTVKVDELMVEEKYSHVIHIVSNIKGEIKENIHPVDVVKAMFPGGTITGAPKVRTMEIIEELEPTKRALYTGSVGYIDFNGNLDFNIVIRTMILKERKGFLQVGAGIVWDSDPEKEYKETLNKAKAFLSLLK